MAAQQILTEAKARGVRFCNLEFTDIVGMAKAVTVPMEQLPASLEEGRWFDGSAIEGFARVIESDMYLRPDAATFTVIPWEPGRARILCDVVRPDGAPFEGDPRARLRVAIAHAARHGLRYEVAPEIEFFLLKPPADGSFQAIPFDSGSYFDLVNEPTAEVWRELMDVLDELHVPVESSHHEVADGQHEIDIVGVAQRKPAFIGTVKWQRDPLDRRILANLERHARALGVGTELPWLLIGRGGVEPSLLSRPEVRGYSVDDLYR